MKRFKYYLACALTAGFLLSPTGCSDPIKNLKPEVRGKVEAYEDIFRSMSPESRKNLVELLEKGLEISEEQHKKNIDAVVKTFKDYQNGDQNKNALILLSDKDYVKYKDMTFNCFKDVETFLDNSEEYMIVYISKKEDFLVIINDFQYEPMVRFRKRVADTGLNGLHLGEDDFLSVVKYVPMSGRQAYPLDIELFDFDFKKETKSEDLLEKDKAVSRYKILAHDTVEMLRNQTDLGYLFEKYYKEKQEKRG